MNTEEPAANRCCAANPSLARKADTTNVRATHQVAEPKKTPSTSAAVAIASWPANPRPTNAAAKDRIVAGLTIVRAAVVAYADSSVRGARSIALSRRAKSERIARAMRKDPPRMPSGRRALTRRSAAAVRPKAATDAYKPSTVAAPSPETRPTAVPSTRVRRMHSNPIGPIAAAMANPTTRPRRNAGISSTSSIRCSDSGRLGASAGYAPRYAFLTCSFAARAAEVSARIILPV